MITQKEGAPQECAQPSYITQTQKKPSGFMRNLIWAAVILVVSVAGSIIMTAFPTGQTFETEGMTHQPATQEPHGAYMTININTASSDELSLLPGVGETTANNIILFREAYGGFVDINELLMVSGIDWDKFEKIRNLVTVGETVK